MIQKNIASSDFAIFLEVLVFVLAGILYWIRYRRRQVASLYRIAREMEYLLEMRKDVFQIVLSFFPEIQTSDPRLCEERKLQRSCRENLKNLYRTLESLSFWQKYIQRGSLSLIYEQYIKKVAILLHSAKEDPWAGQVVISTPKEEKRQAVS